MQGLEVRSCPVPPAGSPGSPCLARDVSGRTAGEIYGARNRSSLERAQELLEIRLSSCICWRCGTGGCAGGAGQQLPPASWSPAACFRFGTLMKTNFQMSFFFLSERNSCFSDSPGWCWCRRVERGLPSSSAGCGSCASPLTLLLPRPGWHGVRGSVPPAGDGGTPKLLEASPWHRSAGEGLGE